MPIPPRRSLIFFALISLLVGLAIIGVGASTPLSLSGAEAKTSPCTATTDPEIVAAVQAKIKADKRFNDQWKHINVSSLNRVVTINGWAKGQTQVNALLGFARSNKCVKKVVNKLVPHMRVGCAVGQKQCGDICIDRNEQCNLLQDSGGQPQ